MSTLVKSYHTAPNVQQTWTFANPPQSLRGQKMQLLTVGGISVVGNWYGEFGQYFVGFAPLLQVDKAALALAMQTRNQTDKRIS
jgi:hypothetical protein